LRWIGIKYDGDEYIQSQNINKHKEIANELIKKGFAYKCYCSEEEINEQKEKAKKNNIPFIYNRKWRDVTEQEIPKNIKPVVRFKSKISGNTIIKDLVQGEINISNSTIEDFIILRNDDTPTYQLSAVVDDHQMNITHVIRGDDHKINTFKQKQIYEAMRWKIPEFAHIPLIHSKEGKKLSKRDNASTLSDYTKIGILPEALRNYLLRLGWSYKDKEIFTQEESIKCFNLSGVGKSPSKLDMERILSINEHYIKNLDERELYKNLKVYAEKYKKKIDIKFEKNLINSIHFLKNKAKKLEDIYYNAGYIINENINITDQDSKLIDDTAKKIIRNFLIYYEKIDTINKENLVSIINNLINSNKTNFKTVGQPLRIALTGSKFGPGIYDIILSLDKSEVLKRLKIID
jgi:glutamyl-tRNA synthetase